MFFYPQMYGYNIRHDRSVAYLKILVLYHRPIQMKPVSEHFFTMFIRLSVWCAQYFRRDICSLLLVPPTQKVKMLKETNLPHEKRGSSDFVFFFLSPISACSSEVPGPTQGYNFDFESTILFTHLNINTLSHLATEGIYVLFDRPKRASSVGPQVSLNQMSFRTFRVDVWVSVRLSV